MTNKVSVIIPCYNYADLLPRAVGSIVSAAHPDIDVIIINDGSTDDSERVGKQLASEYANVQYVYKDNGGLSSVRNLGVQLAPSEYVIFLDTDDMLNVDVLLEFLQSKQALDKSIYFFDYEAVHEEGTANYRKTFKDWQTDPLQRCIDYMDKKISLASGCALIRKSWFADIRFNESIHSSEDLPVYHAMLITPDVEYCAKPLARIFHHEGSMRSQSWRILKYPYDCIDEIFRNPKTRDLLQPIKNQLYARRALSNFRTCYLDKEYRQAKRFYLHAIKNYPRLLLQSSYLFKFLAIVFKS